MSLRSIEVKAPPEEKLSARPLRLRSSSDRNGHLLPRRCVSPQLCIRATLEDHSNIGIPATEYAEKVTFYAEPATVEVPASEPSTQTPSPPPSPTDEIPSSSAATPTPRTRRKPFTAYLNLALSTEVAASLTSPRRRGSVSSSSTSNSNSTQPRILSILSPTTPSSFKSPRTPKTPVPVQRTQPYGAPFFAPMPTGEYAYDERYRREFAKRRSSQRKVSGSASDVPRSAGARRDSRDGDDEKGHSPGTAKPSNVPGVSFEQAQAQVVSRRRRSSAHRRNVSDGVMTS